jgi:hypothetical protein
MLVVLMMVGPRTAAGAGAGGACAPPLAVGSHPNAWNKPGPTFPMLQNVCFKCFRCFRVMFHMDVAAVVFGCCTCCNCYTHMLQEFVQNVSSVLGACCKCFYLNVAYVANV